MIVLACETSTLLGSVAVSENEKILSFEKSMRQGSHSDSLNSLVEQALAKANKSLKDVDLFTTGIGPGSFTGIRISLNTIKTFAYCMQKPVIGIDSLQNLANQQPRTPELIKLPIVSMVNAYKNMLYVATYKWSDGGLKTVKSPEVIRVQNLADYISEKSVVCGDGFQTYKEFFARELMEKMIRPESPEDEPTAKSLCQLVAANPGLQIRWNELLPLYLRASEAEENLLGIKYQPLI